MLKEWKERLSHKAQFWILLGPALLFATLLITLMHPPAHSEKVWQLGFPLSIFLGLFVTVLSFMEASRFLVAAEEKHREKVVQLTRISLAFQNELKLTQVEIEKSRLVQQMIRDALKTAQAELKTVQDENGINRRQHDVYKEAWQVSQDQLKRRQEELENSQSEQAVHKNSLEAAQTDLANSQRDQAASKESLAAMQLEIDNYRQAIEMFKESLAGAQERSTKLLNELNDLRVHHFQQMLLVTQPVASEAESEVVEEVGKEETEHKYKQLRVQFEEKSQVLHQTRRELFFRENELLVLQYEMEENNIDERSEERDLIGYVAQLENECLDLEEQIVSLEEIVSGLLVNKKAPPRPRKPRKKKEVEPADLFN